MTSMVSAVRPVAGRQRSDNTHPLSYANDALLELATASLDDVARKQAREHIICRCLPVARQLARRYYHCYASTEDLVQVATVGLIHAVDRFDASRNVHFSAFATLTITGEIRRYLRDTAWALRVPRRLQEACRDVNRADVELSQVLGRAPNNADVAKYLGMSIDDAAAARQARAAYRGQTYSLQSLLAGDRDQPIGHLVGAPEPTPDATADLITMRALVGELPLPAKVLLQLRYAEGLSQRQIARRLGKSQGHVSRMLADVLILLRRRMRAPE